MGRSEPRSCCLPPTLPLYYEGKVKTKFFAVLSTIDPDQFILHVQTPVAEFETPPLQVKWSRNEVLFLLSLYKERENFFKDKILWEERQNFVGGNIEGDARERIWLLWCSM